MPDKPNQVNLRPGFADIASGWMLVDSFDDVTARIEKAYQWSKTNGPLLADEEATIISMIATQAVRARKEGII